MGRVARIFVCDRAEQRDRRGAFLQGARTRRIRLSDLDHEVTGDGMRSAKPTVFILGARAPNEIASNDNRKSDDKANIESSGIPPTNDNELALLW